MVEECITPIVFPDGAFCVIVLCFLVYVVSISVYQCECWVMYIFLHVTMATYCSW